MQTNLIKIIFRDFLKNFRYFFDSCDEGFINEAVINMYSRRYERPKSGRKIIARSRYKLDELYLTMEGGFALFHPDIQVVGTFNLNEPAVLMPRYAVYGDYHVLFNLYARMDFAPFIPGRTTTPQMIADLGKDAFVEEYRCMCLKAEVFKKLCALYPATEESLKIISLKKRRLFMKSKTMQERQAATGQCVLSTLVYKGLMRTHSKYRDEYAAALEGENSSQPSPCTVLEQDEQDMERPDEKMEASVSQTSQAIRQLKELIRTLKPIVHDLKVGNLKRVAKSNFVEQDSDDSFTESEIDSP